MSIWDTAWVELETGVPGGAMGRDAAGDADGDGEGDGDGPWDGDGVGEVSAPNDGGSGRGR